MRVGLDITATEVGFKLHANRGIGRYASELGSRLLGDSCPPAHPDVTIAPFRQTALPLPGWLDAGVRLLGEHRHVARQHLLFSGVFSDPLAKRFDMLHFLSQVDTPAWCAVPYCVTVHDLIPSACQPRRGDGRTFFSVCKPALIVAAVGAAIMAGTRMSPADDAATLSRHKPADRHGDPVRQHRHDKSPEDP
jgi:hypothetical protein